MNVLKQISPLRTPVQKEADELVSSDYLVQTPDALTFGYYDYTEKTWKDSERNNLLDIIGWYKTEKEEDFDKVLSKIRDYLETIGSNKYSPVLSAMREEELVCFIHRYDTNGKEAIKAYEILQELNPNKYKIDF